MHGLLIVVDALPAWLVGCLGQDWVHTPHLDRLGAAGTVFDRHFACYTGATEDSLAAMLGGRWTAPEKANDAFQSWKQLEKHVVNCRYGRLTLHQADLWGSLDDFLQRTPPGDSLPVHTVTGLRHGSVERLFAAMPANPDASQHELWLLSLPGVDAITEQMEDADEPVTAAMVEALDDLAVSKSHRPPDEELLTTAHLAAATALLDDLIGRLTDAFTARTTSFDHFLIVTALQGRKPSMAVPRIGGEPSQAPDAEPPTAAEAQSPLIAVSSRIDADATMQRSWDYVQPCDMLPTLIDAFGGGAASTAQPGQSWWERLANRPESTRPWAFTVDGHGHSLFQTEATQLFGPLAEMRSFPARETNDQGESRHDSLKVSTLPDDPWGSVSQAPSQVEGIAQIQSMLAQCLRELGDEFSAIRPADEPDASEIST